MTKLFLALFALLVLALILGIVPVGAEPIGPAGVRVEIPTLTTREESVRVIWPREERILTRYVPSVTEPAGVPSYSVSESSSLVMFGVGLVLLTLRARRRRTR